MARRQSHPATYVTPQRGSHLVGEGGLLAGESKSRIMQVGPIGSGGHRRALTAAQTGRSDRAVVTKSGWRDRRVRDTSILNHPILSCTIIYNQWRQTGAAQASRFGAKRLESLENLVEMGSINGQMDKKGAGGGRLWWRDQPS